MPGRKKSIEKHGLFKLYPSPYNASACDVDIVALHGLNGDPILTWTDKDGHLWLRDSLPGYIPTARIMTFGYDSALRSSRSRMCLMDFAQDLLERLRMKRKDSLETGRPLIFLCHSLGGIVAKQALITASLHRDTYASIVDSTCGIAFFGTPHRGSKKTSTARILSRIFIAAGLAKSKRDNLFEALEISSPVLDTISRLSSELLSKIAIISFHEQKPLKFTSDLVVEPFSAILGFPNERVIPINADHCGISKCSPRHPHRYLPIWSSIQEMVEESLLQSHKRHDDLIDTLFDVHYKASHSKPRQPHPGTGDWIFYDQSFRAWLNSPRSAILSLTGPPGFGKTALTHHIMNLVSTGTHFSKAKTCVSQGIGYFCSDAEQTSEQTILMSLFCQMLLSHPKAKCFLRNCVVKCCSLTPVADLTLNNLWLLLRDVLSMGIMVRTFIFLDGLEQLNPKVSRRIIVGLSNIVDHLNQSSKRTLHVKVLFSSRPSAQQEIAYPWMHFISINRLHMENDIRKYLRDSIAQLKETENTFEKAVSHHEIESIVSKMVRRADGMFLWAETAWESFSRDVLWNEGVLEERLLQLESLPWGINSLYDGILEHTSQKLRKDVWMVFSILALSKRPLREAELGEILAVACSEQDVLIHPGKIQYSPDLFELANTDFTDLITLHSNGMIDLCHSSFKEYVLQTRARHRLRILGKAKIGIAKACLAYISHWDTLTLNSMSEKGRTPRSMRLAGYACTHHLSHLASLPSDHPLWVQYARIANSGFFTHSKPSPLHALLLESCSIWKTDTPISVRKCHEVIRTFVSHNYDLNEKGTHKQGAILNVCCQMAGEADVFKLTLPLLLELGADPNLYPKGKHANLKAALLSRQEDAFNALLRHPKFDPNRTDDFGQSALHHLIRHGSEDSTIALLNSGGIDANIQDRSGFTPLHIAVVRQKVGVVRQLLRMPTVQIYLFDNSGRTPLELARQMRLKQMTKMFIEHSKAFP